MGNFQIEINIVTILQIKFRLIAPYLIYILPICVRARLSKYYHTPCITFKIFRLGLCEPVGVRCIVQLFRLK